MEFFISVSSFPSTMMSILNKTSLPRQLSVAYRPLYCQFVRGGHVGVDTSLTACLYVKKIFLGYSTPRVSSILQMLNC